MRSLIGKAVVSRLLIIALMGIFAYTCFGQFAGGAGTEDDPYRVATAEHLDNVRNHLNRHFIQIADIELGVAPWNTAQGWMPIGINTPAENQFVGNYNGNGHIINGLTINRTGTFIGLFGFGNGATVSNLGLTNVNITGGHRTGALAGQFNASNVNNCYSTGRVAGVDQVGGLLGSSFGTLINYSFTNCIVTGNNTVGGIAGNHSGATTTNSYSRGSVRGTTNQVGGLCGRNAGTVTNCYSTGSVTSNLQAGGLVGTNEGAVNNSYWDIETSGLDVSPGGQGRLTRQMVYPYDLPTTFINWNFEEIWSYDTAGTINDGYPILHYQDTFPRLNPPEVRVDIITIDNIDFFRISWEAVADAESYNIYSSDTPYTDDWGEPIASVGAGVTEYVEMINDEQMKFFYVTASAEEGDVDNMLLVEGGDFTPTPNYGVTLSTYYISKYHVTQREWTAIMGEWEFEFGGNPNNPAERVSWFDAIEYCNRLSLREGFTPAYSYLHSGSNPDDWPDDWNTDRTHHTNISCNWNVDGYRLPTEMEWMFAAMGGNDSEGYTYSGSDDIDEVAWYIGNSGGTTHPVGTKAANELGLFDMSGNVYDWCWDIYSQNLPQGEVFNPTGPATGTDRMVRGGSYNADNLAAMVAARFNLRNPIVRFNHMGLRVCRRIP